MITFVLACSPACSLCVIIITTGRRRKGRKASLAAQGKQNKTTPKQLRAAGGHPVTVVGRSFCSVPTRPGTGEVPHGAAEAAGSLAALIKGIKPTGFFALLQLLCSHGAVLRALHRALPFRTELMPPARHPKAPRAGIARRSIHRQCQRTQDSFTSETETLDFLQSP